MASQIDKTPNNLWKERDHIMTSGSAKSVKRLKSPTKKSQECKKSANDVKIEDVFLNSEYFKFHSGNISSLSFCSGDGENQWTINPKFAFPTRQKLSKTSAFSADVKSEIPQLIDKENSPVKESNKSIPQKSKKSSCQPKDLPENPDKLLEGLFSGSERASRDLITLVTEQMFSAERELQITRSHLMETMSKLNERDLEILQLHEKIQNLQNNKKPDVKKEDDREKLHKTSEDYQRLVVASEKLKKQVKDMEEFLNDYGLVWVGTKEAHQKPDFDKIIKSFQRLNAVASQPKIIQTTTGAKFELPREIPVVLYANGILLRQNDFREYNDELTLLFLQDVEDGYFPSELQKEYPEGVPFEVSDKRHEIYNPDRKLPVFHGRGNRLGSTFDDKPSSLVYLEPLKHPRSHDLHSSLSHDFGDKSPHKKISKKRFRFGYSQDERRLISPRMFSLGSRLSTETEDLGEKLNLKIRYGKEVKGLFVLQIRENQKMREFQTALQGKLCQMFHDDCILANESNIRSTDFEIHFYGRSPFRLSDHLYDSPRNLGIVNNCVLNVTEI